MLKRTPENAKNFILWAVEKLYTLLFYHNCVENIVFNTNKNVMCIM